MCFRRFNATHQIGCSCKQDIHVLCACFWCIPYCTFMLCLLTFTWIIAFFDCIFWHYSSLSLFVILVNLLISAVSVLCFMCTVCIMIQCDETGQLAEVVMSVLCFMQLPTKISMNWYRMAQTHRTSLLWMQNSSQGMYTCSNHNSCNSGGGSSSSKNNSNNIYLIINCSLQ